jgi:hypothetical protein
MAAKNAAVWYCEAVGLQVEGLWRARDPLQRSYCELSIFVRVMSLLQMRLALVLRCSSSGKFLGALNITTVAIFPYIFVNGGMIVILV